MLFELTLSIIFLSGKRSRPINLNFQRPGNVDVFISHDFTALRPLNCWTNKTLLFLVGFGHCVIYLMFTTGWCEVWIVIHIDFEDIWAKWCCYNLFVKTIRMQYSVIEEERSTNLSTDINRTQSNKTLSNGTKQVMNNYISTASTPAKYVNVLDPSPLLGITNPWSFRKSVMWSSIRNLNIWLHHIEVYFCPETKIHSSARLR